MHHCSIASGMERAKAEAAGSSSTASASAYGSTEPEEGEQPMRLTTDSNDTMHTILSDISEAIALLDSLSNEKAFTKGEWPGFLSRTAAQAQQLHGRLAYAFSNHPEWKTAEKKKH